MNNAWSNIKSNDYDAHMSHPNVGQTQMLNRITKEQFELISQQKYPAPNVAILGITNGNGLEHVVACGIAKVIGIDINKTFLDECKERYGDLKSKLNLFQIDLMSETAKAVEIISESDLIIANLIIKHIHLDNFMKIISALPKHNQIISCVIQVNPDGTTLSKSGFEDVFKVIAEEREEENEDLIISEMKNSKFTLTNRYVHDLPNGKQFVRLDFIAYD